MGPWSSATGALVDGLRSRWGIDVAILCGNSGGKVACRIQYSYCDWYGCKQSDPVWVGRREEKPTDGREVGRLGGEAPSLLSYVAAPSSFPLACLLHMFTLDWSACMCIRQPAPVHLLLTLICGEVVG